MTKKTESIQEFLARGGTINVVPSAEEKAKSSVTVRSTVVGPVTLLTNEEADLYYGEKKKPKKSTKQTKKVDINLDCLPEEFRKKLGF